jgi:hypothetical protein
MTFGIDSQTGFQRSPLYQTFGLVKTPFSPDRKNIKLFLQWLLSIKGYQVSISRFSNAN